MFFALLRRHIVAAVLIVYDLNLPARNTLTSMQVFDASLRNIR